jgi:uncharacterized integral membrane protein (TIGR00697 family)
MTPEARKEKVYTIFCVLFSSLIMLGNLTYRKYVVLQVPFHTFELSVGTILYPLTFLITDLIAEFYGKDKANLCVRAAIFMNIMVAGIIAFMDYLPATSWSKTDDATFHGVFGFYTVAFIGSVIACYVSQSLDVYLYLWIRNLTRRKYLWLRNNGSTAISLFIDTCIVNLFMSLFGVSPAEYMWSLVANSYSWKLFFTICSTPIFYGSVKMMKIIFKETRV